MLVTIKLSLIIVHKSTQFRVYVKITNRNGHIGKFASQAGDDLAWCLRPDHCIGKEAMRLWEEKTNKRWGDPACDVLKIYRLQDSLGGVHVHKRASFTMFSTCTRSSFYVMA